MQKEADKKTEEFAEKHGEDSMHYVVGGGMLKGAAYSYAMCYMEEMLWMRTKSISCADFSMVHLKLLKRYECNSV